MKKLTSGMQTAVYDMVPSGDSTIIYCCPSKISESEFGSAFTCSPLCAQLDIAYDVIVECFSRASGRYHRYYLTIAYQRSWPIEGNWGNSPFWLCLRSEVDVRHPSSKSDGEKVEDLRIHLDRGFSCLFPW